MAAPALVRAQELIADRDPLTKGDDGFSSFFGILTEISSGNPPSDYASGQGAGLSVALSLVRRAQLAGEPAVWISATPAVFFPPDARANGVDLDLLPVIFTEGGTAAGRIGEHLLRSGAFGMIVMDLGDDRSLTDAHLGRLGRLAEKQNTAILCLTDLHPPVGLSPATDPRAAGTSAAGGSAAWDDGRHAPGDDGARRPGPASAGAPRDGRGRQSGEVGLGSLVARRITTHRRKLADGAYRVQARVVKDKRGGTTWSYEEVFHAPDGLV